MRHKNRDFDLDEMVFCTDAVHGLIALQSGSCGCGVVCERFGFGVVKWGGVCWTSMVVMQTPNTQKKPTENGPRT